MGKWNFQYKDLISSIDEFAEEHGDDDFLFAWRYTIQMVTAHGLAIRPDNISEKESISVGWSQFEDTFDDDDEGAVISLAGIIANLVTAVPIGKNEEFHKALEVGFARARGFSQTDAIRQHEEWLKNNNQIFEPLNPSELRAKFKVLDGGQSDANNSN